MTGSRKTHWLRTTVIVLLVCGILGTALAAVQFTAQAEKPYISASLQLTFDGAADGLAPNRQAFRIDEIELDQVLEAAIAGAGLEGAVTPDQVRECLTARGAYPEDMVDQVMSYDSLLNFNANRQLNITEYHPTLFSLKLVNGFEPALSRDSLNALMDGIIQAYRTYFAGRYAYAVEDGAAVYDLSSYDYPQQLIILSEAMNQQARYAEEMVERAPAFTWKNQGFNDIAVRLTGLVNNDVDRLNAMIAMNALTRNEGRLRIQYQYQIQALNIQLTQEQKRLSQLDTLIASYDKNEIIYLSTSNALRMIAGNSSVVYDRLVDARRTAADQITAIQAKIVDYRLRIQDLDGQAQEEAAKEAEAAAETAGEDAGSAAAEAAPQAEESDTAAKAAALEQGIARLIVKRDAVTADFGEMLDAFNAQEINEKTIAVIERAYRAPSLISGAFIKQAVMTAGPVCALGFMACMALLIRSRRKEEKRQA